MFYILGLTLVDLNKYIMNICQLDCTNLSNDEVGKLIFEMTIKKYHLIKQDYLEIGGLDMIREGNEYWKFIIYLRNMSTEYVNMSDEESSSDGDLDTTIEILKEGKCIENLSFSNVILPQKLKFLMMKTVLKERHLLV
jgi:hypothetical protein